MGLPYKFNFRNTSGYVTDGAGETYVLPNDTYTGSAVRDGIVFGWETTEGGGGRDRTTGSPNNPSLSGMCFNETLNQDTFRVNLTAGNYTLRFALGDPLGGVAFATLKVEFFDNATSRLLINSATSAGDHFLDPAGTEHTSATNWLANNVASSSLSFASGILRFKIGNNVGTLTGVISHLEIAAVVSATYPASFQLQGMG